MMMMKKKKKKTINNIYNNLQKNRKAIKIRAFLMAGLLLAINSFAWFTFVSNADNNINADVIKWEIEFFDEDSDMTVMDINLEDMFPGMEEYVKSITIRNSSELGATFSYSIDDVVIFGEKYDSENLTDTLLDDFPFYIMFEAPETDIGTNATVPFRVRVGWNYEQTETYCVVRDYYPFDESWDYYNLVDGNYVLTTYDKDSYASKTNDVYVECDDLDTYWGEKNAQYKKEHPDSKALTLRLKLMVTQKEA